MTTLRQPTDEELKVLLDMFSEFRTAMVTTVAANGALFARAMEIQRAVDGMPIWLVADRDSELVQQLNQDARLNICAHRDSDQSWFSIAGAAHLIEDANLIEQLWNDSWCAFFDEDNVSEQAVILKVEPESACFWRPDQARLNQMLGVYSKTRCEKKSLELADSHTFALSNKNLEVASV